MKMMYILPKKIKSLSIYLMVAGFFGLVYGFLSAPKNIDESKAIIAASHGDHRGGEHKDHSLGLHGASPNINDVTNYSDADMDVSSNTKLKNQSLSFFSSGMIDLYSNGL